MGSIPRYELRRDPDTGRWRVWCNAKGADGQPRGWDNGDGKRTYGDTAEEFWAGQRRVNWLNWPQSRMSAGQTTDTHSPEEELAKKRAAARAALEQAGRAYLARTRAALAQRGAQDTASAPPEPKGEGSHAQEQDRPPRRGAAGDDADREGATATGGERAQGTGSGGAAGSVL